MFADTETGPETPEQAAPVNVSIASLRALEFPSLLALIAEGTATDLGHARALALWPTTDHSALAIDRRRFQEARRLASGSPLVALAERPLRPILDAIGDPLRQISGRELVEIGAMLEATDTLCSRLAEAEPACLELDDLVSELPDVEPLRQLLRRTFDSRGEIRPDATPRLQELRSRIRSARGRIYEELTGLLESHREHLSEETIPMRGGRLVLMLNAGARGRMPGLVHGRSGTGRSFYFEPMEAVESNNRLQQSVEDEEAERARIFKEVLERLGAARPDLEAHAELVATLDLLQSSVRFAEAADARLADIGERHELQVLGARHPLLDPGLADLRSRALGQPGHTGSVVPLELELSTDQRALVVTGPNAGGKTVSLKALGLLCLANQCGLPIPVRAGTRLPILDALVATVGDDQDLLADRSTFSGRLLRLKEAWEKASPDALILLDELGSGTDPEEGAALSTALLEGLVKSQSLVVITTHLSQVAAAALETDGAFCAAMQFDATTGGPTYRLHPGPPGGSEALSLAHRLGLPKLWLERAEALLGSDHRNLRRLLAEVESQRQRLEDSENRLATEIRDAESLRRRLAQEERALAEERRTLAKSLGQKLDNFQRDVQGKLRREMERLRQEMDAGRRKGLAAEAVERLWQEAPALAPPAGTALPIEVGAKVRHRRLGWIGELEKLDRGKAQVTVKGKVFVCKAKDLTGIADGEYLEAAGTDTASRKRSRTERKSPPRGQIHVVTSDRASQPSELMLVGQRVEPALDRLDRFLDRALLASQAEVRIIHGFGTGRLRDAVRQHLRSHPAVESQRPGGDKEGGDGATVVSLRG